MSSVKDRMIKVIERQPEDCNFGEILREFAFVKMVERGLEDTDAGRIITHQDMGMRMQAWRK